MDAMIVIASLLLHDNAISHIQQHTSLAPALCCHGSSSPLLLLSSLLCCLCTYTTPLLLSFAEYVVAKMVFNYKYKTIHKHMERFVAILLEPVSKIVLQSGTVHLVKS